MRNFELTLDAEGDLTGIWLSTYETSGLEQAEKYYDLIVSCCQAVGNGKARSKALEGLPDDIRVHRCEQHYIFFMGTDHPIILAILHADWASSNG